MGIANKIRADIRSLQQASRNASQATALVQVAEGAVGTVSNILDRMKELATQSASDSVTTTDRGKIQTEYSQLQLEINRIANTTKYQGQQLLKGTYGMSMDATASTTDNVLSMTSFDVSGAKASTSYVITMASTGAAAGAMTLTASFGAGASTSQTITYASLANQTFNFDRLGVKFSTSNWLSTDVIAGTKIETGAALGGTFQVGSENAADLSSQVSLTLGNLTTVGLGVDAALGTDITSARAALDAIDAGITTINGIIGTIGAASNRFDYAIQNLQSIIENMGAAESVIRDADVGQEMTVFTKAQILSQAGTAMLAQANAAPQSVLSLLKG
jgi:flagellin